MEEQDVSVEDIEEGSKQVVLILLLSKKGNVNKWLLRVKLW